MAPLVGKQANHLSDIYKERMKSASFPRLSGKVSTARLTKGASMGRNGKRFHTERYKCMPVILERSEESRQSLQDFNVITCVRTLTPIASQSSALPSAFGGS